MSSEAKRPCLEEDIAVTTFRRYLRINTSHPNPDYGMATDYHLNYASYCGITFM